MNILQCFLLSDIQCQSHLSQVTSMSILVFNFMLFHRSAINQMHVTADSYFHLQNTTTTVAKIYESQVLHNLGGSDIDGKGWMKTTLMVKSRKFGTVNILIRQMDA